MPEDSPPRPYDVHVVWIDGGKESFPVRFHVEYDHYMSLILNDRKVKQVTIPYSNVKLIEVDKG